MPRVHHVKARKDYLAEGISKGKPVNYADVEARILASMPPDSALVKAFEEGEALRSARDKVWGTE